MACGKGQKIQRFAARVEIQNRINPRQEFIVEIGRDFLCDRAPRISRKGAVHIALINRRCAACRQKGGRIHLRQNDDPPRDIRGLKRIGQIMQGNRPFILIPMIAARQQNGRAIPIADDADRNHNVAPCAVIAAMGQAQMAMRLAHAIKGNGWGHFTNTSRGKLDRHSTPVSVIRIGSVISSPPSSNHKAGMKWKVIPGLRTERSPRRKLIVRSPQSGG